MSTTGTKGRKIQIKQGMSADFDDSRLDVGEFGLLLDTNDVRIGLADGTTKSLTSGGGGGGGDYTLPTATSTVLGGVKIGDNISISGGSISVENSTISTKGIVQLNDTLTSTAIDQALTANQGKSLKDAIDNIISQGGTVPDATTTNKGLMTTDMVIKLNSISSGANFTTVVDDLNSTSTSSALSANQGKELKGMIDDIVQGSVPIATSSTLGGVKIGTNVNATSDGTISINNASTTNKGLVQLNNTVTSASTTEAATANAVKQLNDNLSTKATNLDFSVIISTAWTGTASPYTQVIPLTGILASDNPIVFPTYDGDNNTAILQEEAWGKVSKITTSSNSITVTCFKDKPTVSIPVQIKVIR